MFLFRTDHVWQFWKAFLNISAAEIWKVSLSLRKDYDQSLESTQVLNHNGTWRWKQSQMTKLQHPRNYPPKQLKNNIWASNFWLKLWKNCLSHPAVDVHTAWSNLCCTVVYSCTNVCRHSWPYNLIQKKLGPKARLTIRHSVFFLDQQKWKTENFCREYQSFSTPTLSQDYQHERKRQFWALLRDQIPQIIAGT